MAKTNMAVYDLKQAEQILGKFEKKHSRVQDTKKVSVEYAEAHNERFEQTGSYYEVNDKLNKEYIALTKKK